MAITAPDPIDMITIADPSCRWLDSAIITYYHYNLIDFLRAYLQIVQECFSHSEQTSGAIIL